MVNNNQKCDHNARKIVVSSLNKSYLRGEQQHNEEALKGATVVSSLNKSYLRGEQQLIP